VKRGVACGGRQWPLSIPLKSEESFKTITPFFKIKHIPHLFLLLWLCGNNERGALNQGGKGRFQLKGLPWQKKKKERKEKKKKEKKRKEKKKVSCMGQMVKKFSGPYS
jgi:hypothetical protein